MLTRYIGCSAGGLRNRSSRCSVGSSIAGLGDRRFGYQHWMTHGGLIQTADTGRNMNDVRLAGMKIWLETWYRNDVSVT